MPPVPSVAPAPDRHSNDSPGATGPSGAMTLLLAAACGLVAANLYYAQPLISLIAPAVGLPTNVASFIVTLTQVGYCLGLLLLVPLGDLLENRRLILGTLWGAIVMVAVMSQATSSTALLMAAFGVGLLSVVIQMIVPMAAHLSPEHARGRTVGNVMSGLLVGIMLARPTASLIAGSFGWRAVLESSVVALLVLAALLWLWLPSRRPAQGPRYAELMASMIDLWRSTPLLRRRALYQAALFGLFSLYWTAVPLLLSGPVFGLSQHGIAWFALAGVAGALAAPVAGRMADRGLGRRATTLAMVLVLASFAAGWLGGRGSLVALLAAGIALDLGVQANLVVGQRSIYTLGAAIRSRLNALYMATFFAGGALGSSVASAAFAHGGWSAITAIGVLTSLAVMAYAATDRTA